jgi:hypothetical protein
MYPQFSREASHQQMKNEEKSTNSYDRTKRINASAKVIKNPHRLRPDMSSLSVGLVPFKGGFGFVTLTRPSLQQSGAAQVGRLCIASTNSGCSAPCFAEKGVGNKKLSHVLPRHTKEGFGDRGGLLSRCVSAIRHVVRLSMREMTKRAISEI